MRGEGVPPARRLSHGEVGGLYDAHAARLLAHSWSLVGTGAAAAAVRDAFVAAVQHPPRGDKVLWLYALSRSSCAELGAFGDPMFGASVNSADPLLRAAAGLHADHREALLLWAGEWLDVPDIARVLGVAPDTVRTILETARARLERTVLDLLMRSTQGAPHDVIAAFEKGRLAHLLARRVPDVPPPWLRDQVLAACETEAAHPMTEVVAPSPLVVIGSDVAARPGAAKGRRSHKGLGAVAGLAASVAATFGAIAAWPSSGPGKGDVSALVPSASSERTQPATDRTSAPRTTGTPTTNEGGASGTLRPDGTGPSAATDTRYPTAGTPYAGAGRPSAQDPRPATPSERPDRTLTPPKETAAPGSPTPTTPAPTKPDPTTPAPSDPPPTTPEPSDPPPTGTPGEPSPSPSTNPTPSPKTSD